MTAEDAIRFLEHESQVCRDRDDHEALCLLLPALLRALDLQKMNDWEARAFRSELRAAVQRRTPQERVESRCWPGS